MVDARVFDAAGTLPGSSLRSLDALHLATAQQLGDDLAGVVTYDERQADAARALPLEVKAPGTARR